MTLALRGPRDPIPVEVLVQRIELAGGPDRLVAIARDITDRVEAQARLQRLAEAEHARAAELDAVIHAMGEAVFVCAADGTIVLANPAAEGMFPEVEERSYAEVLANLDDPTGIAPKLHQHGGPVELRARGEEERWIELSTYAVGGRPATDAGPETIVVLRDVTESRQRQAVRDTFVGILAHELRTPVTTIYGGSKISTTGRTACRTSNAARCSRTSPPRPSGCTGWSRTSSRSTASGRRVARRSATTPSCSSGILGPGWSRPRRSAGRA